MEKVEFLFTNYTSYSEFFDNLQKVKISDGFEEIFFSFLDYLQKSKGTNSIVLSRKSLYENLLHLYRYVVSTGDVIKEKTKQIQYYNSLRELFATTDVTFTELEVPWSIAFQSGVMSSFISDGDFYRGISNYDFQINDKTSYSYIVNRYMVRHLAIMELFGLYYLQCNKSNKKNAIYEETLKDFKKKVDTYGHRNVNDYIMLVNENNYLETVFGITIEYDLIMVHECLGYGS